jgi:prolyl oligopeptidase PreP (S9A serine peptidase family)
MVTTGDHDDRVVPHSFKFAELQEKQTGNDPVLIRIDVKGHGAGNHWQRLFKKMSIFRHSRCIIWVSKYQKLNNLDLS